MSVNIQWVIDDSAFGIVSGKKENIEISDDTKCYNHEVIAAVEAAVAKKFNGRTFWCSITNTDFGDFVIENMDEVLEKLAEVK